MRQRIDAAGSVPIDATPGNHCATANVELQLCGIIARHLAVQGLDRDDDFFDMGGNSMKAMEIMAEIEQRFGCKLPIDVLIEAPTPAALAVRLAATAPPDTSPLLLRFQAGENRWAPLFLVHGLRGHVFLPPDLITAIDPRRPVYGIQARGLSGDPTLSRSVDAAAQDYLDAIETITRGAPFHLGAFCGGCLIALEMSAMLGDSRPGARSPILIDPPTTPLANCLRDRRFGGIRLAWRRLRGHRVVDRKRMKRTLARGNQIVRYWRPDIEDAAANERLCRVAANMQYLLTSHIVRDAPLSPVLLTSRQRAHQVTRSDSFWSRMYGERMRVHVVATNHRTVFTDDRHRVFRCVNDLIDERDRERERTAASVACRIS